MSFPKINKPSNASSFKGGESEPKNTSGSPYISDRPTKKTGKMGRLGICAFTYLACGVGTAVGVFFIVGRRLAKFNLLEVEIMMGACFIVGGFAGLIVCMKAFKEVDSDS